MADKFSVNSSLLSRLIKFFKALRIVLKGNFFLISLGRTDSQELKASLICKGLPYFTQVLYLQTFINNEFSTTFVNGNYKISASDFIDHLPEVKFVGDLTVKVGIAVYDSTHKVIRIHNQTFLKLKKAPKITKKELLKSTWVIFR